MSFESFSSLLGGLALFLLGMQLMTDGLRHAAGKQLKKILQTATHSHLRGLLSGTTITAIVQASGAVTVATIGFVNAGLLSLSQSITVIFGCNIGTTITGWLVALIGFKFKLSSFALPMLAVGMLIKVSANPPRWQHLGVALAGFGLFFVGLDFIKQALEGLENGLPLQQIDPSIPGLLLATGIGFTMTVLMQSSSASMAVILSLTAGANMPLSAAAAAIIGANLGTTSTAVVAVIGATANAKRIAAAHVIFNLVTGAIGFLLLLAAASQINKLYDLFDPVILLALFHTLFNLLGVALFWFFIPRLGQYLQRLFRSQEEDLSTPRFLDKNILPTPNLAIDAMAQELCRVSQLTSAMAREAVSTETGGQSKLEAEMASILKLNKQIGKYNQKIAQETLSEEISNLLPAALRVTRYYSEIARLSALLPEYYEYISSLSDRSLQEQIHSYQQATIALIDSCEIHPDYCDTSDSRKLIEELEKRYQRLKSTILEHTVDGSLKASDSINLLDALSHIHRLAEQVEKAARYWSSITPMQARQPATHS